jgi:hypothetical protein
MDIKGIRKKARRRMKIMFSISHFYCRGLIYQARPGRFTHRFDESNREASTIEFILRRTAIFIPHDTAPSFLDE